MSAANIEDVKKECAKSPRSAVIILKNECSHTLAVKNANIHRGKWQVPPANTIEPGQSVIIALRSTGIKLGVKADISYQVQTDKNRTYIVSLDNPWTEPPEKLVNAKVAVALTTAPQKAAIEVLDQAISNGQVVGTVRVVNI